MIRRYRSHNPKHGIRISNSETNWKTTDSKGETTTKDAKDTKMVGDQHKALVHFFRVFRAFRGSP